MSRGGRGRGRGGRLNVPGYDYETSLTLDSEPSELFPPYRIPVAVSPTEKEKREVAFYLGLREQIHKGPLYTAPQTRDIQPCKVYGEDQFNSQFDNKMKTDVDPFEGMPRYSWRYDQQKRAIPQLSARPFDKALFPEELWSTLEGEEGKAVRKTINNGMKKKVEILPSTKDKGASMGLSAEEKSRKVLEKIKSVVDADEADGEVDREDDDEDIQEEEKDYDYEEDEAEMGGDYGAEQYFDGGEGDDDDAMDAGGGDDY